MAAVTLLGSATFNTNSGTKTVTATPAVDDLIVIITAHTGNTSSATPTDGQGGNYTLVNSAVKATSADTMRVWVRNTKITSASSTVFSHAPGTSTGGGLAVLKVTGMQRVGSAAVRQSAIQSNQGASGTPTPVLGSAALTGNALIGAVFNATNPATMTPRSSPAYTERADAGYATPTTGLEVMSINSGETATSIAWGGTSGSAFASVIVELDNSDATPLDDGDWWAGAQNCFVGLAIAGAAAALSTSVAIAGSFTQQDPVPQVVSTVGFEATGLRTARRQQEAQQVRWYAGQDEIPQAIALDDSGFEPFRYSAPLPVVQGPQWDDQTLFWRIDEQYAWESWRVVTPPVAQPVSDDDQFVAPPASALDEDGWLPTSAAPAPFVLSWFDADVLPGPALDDDYWWQAPIVQTIQAPRAFESDDEVVAEPGGQGSGGLGLPFYAQRAHHQTTFVKWHHQDELPAVVAGFVPPDDDPPNLPRSLDSVTTFIWATNDDFVPQPTALQVDEQYWWQPESRIVPPVLRLWLGEDERPTPVAFTPVEEDAPALLRNQDAATAVVWATDDDLVPQPRITEDYWQQPYSIPATIWAKVWDQPDEWPTPSAPLGVDEDYWQQFPAPPEPFVLARLGFLADDESIDWFAPPAPVVDDRAAKWKRHRLDDEPYEDPPRTVKPQVEPKVDPKPAPKPAKVSRGELLRQVKALSEQTRVVADAAAAQQRAQQAAQALAIKEAEAAQKVEQAIQRSAEEQALEDDDEEAIAIAVSLLLR